MSDSPLANPQEQTLQLPALTGLRGFAALWVLLYHVWAMSGGPALQVPGANFLEGRTLLSIGWAGVDLFFCLSAFLLVIPYAKWRYAAAARPDTGRYLMRRVLRIYPAYLIQLGVLLLIALAFGYGSPLGASELLAHLLLWFNMGWHWVTPMVGVWFTLPIEFAFYLVLPFLAPLLDRRRWPWLLIGSLTVSIGYRYFMHLAVADEPVPVQVIALERLPGRIDQFVIGMIAGAAFVAASLHGWRPRRTGLWFVAGVLGIIGVSAALFAVADRYWGGHPLLYMWHALFSIGLVPVLLASAWNARPALWLLANAPMRYLGDVSFGLYLWHMPIILAIAPRLPAEWSAASRFWILLSLALPASALVAALSHHFVERPFLRHKPSHRQ